MPECRSRARPISRLPLVPQGQSAGFLMTPVPNTYELSPSYSIRNRARARNRAPKLLHRLIFSSTSTSTITITTIYPPGNLQHYSRAYLYLT